MTRSRRKDKPTADAKILPFSAAAKPAEPLAARPSPVPPVDEDDVEPLSTRTLIGIGIFLVFLIVTGVWLMDAMRENGIREDCLMQGRKNCGPIPTLPRDR